MSRIYDTGHLRVDIRAYRPIDKLPVLNIDLKSYELEWPEEKWKTAGPQTLVAQATETPLRVVGFCHADMKDGALRLIRFAVTPAFRRHKIATSLLAELLRLNPKAKLVTALIGESQEDALRFLTHHGFRKTSSTPDYPVTGGTETGYLFEGTIPCK